MHHKLTLLLPPAMAGFAALLLLAPGTPKEEEIQSHRNLGKAFFENPVSVAQAPDEFKKALELDPKSDRDRLNYGITLIKGGHIPEGVAELSEGPEDLAPAASYLVQSGHRIQP